jgi:sensor histidine kinase YesM/sugar lactone lactonase YvrE
MQAQQPVSIHITEKDGLPDNEFYNILEDSKGYIWLAADKGLFRFDGTEYKIFQHPEQIGLSVFQLHEDINGAIWFVNISGQVFYIKDEKITLFNTYKNELNGAVPRVSTYNDLLILNDLNILLVVNIKTKTIVFKNQITESNQIKIKLKNSTNVELNTYQTLNTIYKDTMYFGMYGKLIKAPLSNLNKRISLPFTNKNKQFIQRSTISIIDRKGVFYANGKQELTFYKFNSNFKNGVTELKHNFPNIRILTAKTINNQIWYCTQNGVYVCEIEGEYLVIKRHLFPDEFITDLQVDKHNNYWFSTVNNGLFVVPNITVNTVSLALNTDKIAQTALVNTNELLISTRNKILYKYNDSSKIVQSFVFKENLEIVNLGYNTFNNKDYVYTNFGAYEFNSKFKNTNKLRVSGRTKDIKIIDEELTMTAEGDRVRIYKNLFQGSTKNILFEEEVRGYTVFYDRKHDLRYFATIEGLFTLDKNLNKQYVLHNGNPIYVNAITQTKNGNLWCSSFKNGIFEINKNSVISNYTTNEGLLSNSNSYIKAKENTFWIAGNNGIQQFNTKTGAFKNLTKNEGVVSYNYNGLEIINDNVFVSSPEQLIYFNENKVFKPYNTPEVFFTDVIIDNNIQELKPSYTFSEKESSVSINYNAVGFKTSTSGQFEYRLLGFNSNWISSALQVRTVQYNSLLEGDYTFQIRNVTVNTTDSKIQEIQFKVTKPFWEKLWFYAICGLLLISLIFLFYKNKNRLREKEKNKQLKQLEVNNELINLKLENLRSQMNPHFVFNALNSIQDYIFSNQKNLAGDYLGKFADLMRIYLDQSNRGKISLEEERDTLNKYLELEKLRFEDSLEYQINIENTLEPETIFIPTMLIQPYVENALKHGLLHKKDNRKLHVSISKLSEDLLECIIEDNGIGRERAKQINQKRIKTHEPFALKATTKRLDLLNYGRENKIGVTVIDLHENNEATGTRVTLTTPIIID